MKKSLFLIVFLANTILLAQTGSVKIKIIDNATFNAIPFAYIGLVQDGEVIVSSETEISGVCIIDSVSAGSYTIRVKTGEYQVAEILDIIVIEGKTTSVTIKMKRSAKQLQVEEIAKGIIGLFNFLGNIKRN